MRQIAALAVLTTLAGCASAAQNTADNHVIWCKPYFDHRVTIAECLAATTANRTPPDPAAVAAEQQRQHDCIQQQMAAGYVYGYGIDRGWHYSCALGRITPLSGF